MDHRPLQGRVKPDLQHRSGVESAFGLKKKKKLSLCSGTACLMIIVWVLLPLFICRRWLEMRLLPHRLHEVLLLLILG